VTLSVVVPVYNEARCLEALWARLGPALDAVGEPAEVVFVDDASRDGSFTLLAALAARDRRVRALRLAANVGSQGATLCGLAAARGDAVVTMDADLQHPPELIGAMVGAWRRGHEVVHMVRRRSASQGRARDAATRAFYRVWRLVTDVDLSPDSTDFRLLDRRCAAALVGRPGAATFVRAMVRRLGARETSLAFDVPARFAGTSTYTWPRLVGTALLALAAHARVPLPTPARPAARVAEVVGQGLGA
jgi:dolichol-phosphate mannosyltransferase